METMVGPDSWAYNLLYGALLTYVMVGGGWVLARAGRSPLWILALLIPFVNVAAFWVFAYTRWPKIDRRP